jgi:hypothetical protein
MLNQSNLFIHQSVQSVAHSDVATCTVVAHLFTFRYAQYGYGYIDGIDILFEKRIKEYI